MKKQITSEPGPEDIKHTQSQTGEGFVSENIQDDAVFGEIREGDTNYRDVSWMGTTALMIKAQIGLSVLSMPKVFDILGIVPGIIILLTIARMTSWSNWMVGVFKLRHPSVYGIDDVGKMLFGRVGFELSGAAYTLCECSRSYRNLPVALT
ncbi:hypothetical protein BDV27DRAFT_168408 [Aspergillus caelatus]|uniref:Amino acid transporter transmembrane domain-containing protein n=1 Tax=Aspergillus caelatus TaxID=61420 RepID=A0A5N6ZPS4_9EURO|nr:uncharacterized protein BDV27DRAFT_168408 [Aspergillus caelatus]KAE8359617.1 hypothetical protein BDV27DRAFT_168408 [Aspergillus caelatus]